MPGKIAQSGWNVYAKYELPDFEEAFNFQDLVRFYERKDSNTPFNLEDSQDEMEILFEEDLKSKPCEYQDLFTNFNNLELENTRPNTPTERATPSISSTPAIKMMEIKSLYPEQNEMTGQGDNTEFSYINGFWLNYVEELDDKKSLQTKLDGDDSMTMNVVSCEKKEEEKPLAKEKKIIFNIIRTTKPVKLKKFSKSLKMKPVKKETKPKFSKVIEDNKAIKNNKANRANKLNTEVIKVVDKVKRKRIKKKERYH